MKMAIEFVVWVLVVMSILIFLNHLRIVWLRRTDLKVEFKLPKESIWVSLTTTKIPVLIREMIFKDPWVLLGSVSVLLVVTLAQFSVLILYGSVNQIIIWWALHTIMRITQVISWVRHYDSLYEPR